MNRPLLVLIFGVLTGGFFASYVGLRATDLTAVDGATRSCEIYYRNELFFHGNNHLFYPANVRVWNRAVASLLGPSADPYDTARRTQAMNGLAVALSVGLLFLLMRSAGATTAIALGSAVAYGCSHVVVLHATNAAEPPVGLFFSFLAAAMAAAGRSKSRMWLAGLAGVCLAAAMASYQTMILVGPAVLLLCASPTPDDGGERRRQVYRIVFFFAGSAVGTAILYQYAYSHSGVLGVGEQLRRFLTVDGGTKVYGGVSASKLINTPVGLIGGVFPVLSDYSGLRNLWREHGLDIVVLRLIAAALVCLTTGLVLAVAVWRRRDTLAPSLRLAFRVVLLGLACTLVGPLYWDPMYDKMWLQPVALVLILFGLALASVPPSRTRSIAACVLTALLLIEVVSNGAWAVPEAGREPRYVAEAREVEGLLGPDDLVIYGWDGVSVLFEALSDPARPRLCIPTAGGELGPTLVGVLHEKVNAAKARGAKVYFLGILDLNEQTWKPFLGDRLRVPYNALEEYRRRSKPVKTFTADDGSLTLRLYEPD